MMGQISFFYLKSNWIAFDRIRRLQKWPNHSWNETIKINNNFGNSEPKKYSYKLFINVQTSDVVSLKELLRSRSSLPEIYSSGSGAGAINFYGLNYLFPR